MIRIATVTLPVPTTGTRWQHPPGLMWFTMQCRTAVAIRMSHLEDKVVNSVEPYYTIKSGDVLKEDKLEDLDPKQDFFFAAASAVVLEITMGIKEG